MKQTHLNAEKAQAGIMPTLSELKLELIEAEEDFYFIDLMGQPLKTAFNHLYFLREVIKLEEEKLINLN